MCPILSLNESVGCVSVVSDLSVSGIRVLYRMNMMKSVKFQMSFYAVLFGLLTLALGGCTSSPDPGVTGGRMDSYRSTEADVYSNQASVPAMLEFSDQTAEALARDLTQLPEIQQRTTRAILMLGDINNKSNTNTNDFEMITIRTRNKIVGLRHIVDNFKVVENLDRMRNAEAREVGVPQDLLQEGRATTYVANYNPADIYVLNGDFYESSRGSTRRYYFAFTLSNMASREIVFREQYDLAQR